MSIYFVQPRICFIGDEIKGHVVGEPNHVWSLSSSLSLDRSNGCTTKATKALSDGLSRVRLLHEMCGKAACLSKKDGRTDRCISVMSIWLEKTHENVPCVYFNENRDDTFSILKLAH